MSLEREYPPRISYDERITGSSEELFRRRAKFALTEIKRYYEYAQSRLDPTLHNLNERTRRDFCKFVEDMYFKTNDILLGGSDAIPEITHPERPGS